MPFYSITLRTANLINLRMYKEKNIFYSEFSPPACSIQKIFILRRGMNRRIHNIFDDRIFLV